MEADLKLLPTRPRPVQPNAFPQKVKQLTNHYDLGLLGGSEIHQYVIDITPDIEDESIHMLRVLGKSLATELRQMVDLIAHKGKVLWGGKSVEQALSFKPTYEGRQF